MKKLIYLIVLLLLINITYAFQYQPGSISNEIVYYSINESAGTTINDFSTTTAVNGNIINSIANNFVPGLWGNMLYLRGMTEYVSIHNRTGTPYTVVLRFNTTDNGDIRQALFGYDNVYAWISVEQSGNIKFHSVAGAWVTLQTAQSYYLNSSIFMITMSDSGTNVTATTWYGGNRLEYLTTTHASGNVAPSSQFYIGRLEWDESPPANNGSTYYLNGSVEEFLYFSKVLSMQEIESLANQTIIDYTPNIAFSFNDTSYPPTNNSYNQIYMNVIQNATIINNSINCSLIVNGIINTTKTYENLSDQPYFFTMDFYNIYNSPREINYSISCISNINGGGYNTTTKTFYLDTIYPNINSDFINSSVWYKSLNINFNFTDDFYLNSYNISIDGKTRLFNESLFGNFTQIYFTTNISNLTAGLHNLSIKLADGHTANKIPDYGISTGLFGDYLQFSWNDKGKTKKAKIKQDSGSIFDTFTTTKQLDRYVWSFEPSTQKPIYHFIIETDDIIKIIEDDSTYLKKWITFGNKWMDFDLYGENSTIEINRLNDKSVKVTISNIQNPGKQNYKSIGDLNIVEVNYTFYKLNASVQYQEIVFEGSITSQTLSLETANILNLNVSINNVWNNMSMNTSRTNVSSSEINFVSSFLVPFINASNTTWFWYFNVSDGNFNISGLSNFVQMNITNCSAGNYIILNYTIYDEETQTIPTGVNATIETYLLLTTPSYEMSFYNFSVKVSDTNLLICLPNNTLNYSTFILDALTKYQYDDHVEEFHYIENFELNNTNIPLHMSLYDLLTTDSTSFLVTYQDENYLYVEGVIVDLLRQYTSLNGEFFSVEHAKTDQGGQTRLHFVTEDVIYKANVWSDGLLVYTTGEFFALCQTTPCQLSLRKPYNESEQISTYDNIVYEISDQSDFYSTKKITFDFSTNDGSSTTIIMNVTKSTLLFNETICSSSKTLSSGSIVCTIPLSYYNTTYTARVYKDGKFIGWRTYSMEQNADDIFGDTGILLGALGYLMLGLMGVSSAQISVILGIIGFICMGAMNLIIGGSIFGVGSSIIWLIIAGAILVWKYQQRRVQ